MLALKLLGEVFISRRGASRYERISLAFLDVYVAFAEGTLREGHGVRAGQGSRPRRRTGVWARCASGGLQRCETHAQASNGGIRTTHTDLEPGRRSHIHILGRRFELYSLKPRTLQQLGAVFCSQFRLPNVNQRVCMNNTRSCA
ncbi:hypothetical protein PsYK624_170740 [Phanerochaete sordida]|uniref:Uncharacterized protein n=1 Tax=Phanerochaete sordida TaxID=48140 RepID=A0A9P3GRX7_9APHY|nr:hypothetical protein PsYK624_170740 [Phanerochaete sordida]